MSRKKLRSFGLVIICAVLTIAYLSMDDNESTGSLSHAFDDDTPELEKLSERLLNAIEASRAEAEIYSAFDNPSSESIVELAAARSGVMAALMRSDPEQALEQSIGYAEYHRLPTEVQAFVERPFSEQGEIEILAICDDDPETPEYKFKLRLKDGSRASIQPTENFRVSFSKRNIPIQGIVLGDVAVVRSEIFQILDSENARWAMENLRMANDDPSKDFLMGDEIGARALVATLGGFAFVFENHANLQKVETQLRSLDMKPGLDANSSALIERIVERGSKELQFESLVKDTKKVAAQDTLETRDYLIIRVDFSDNSNVPFTAEQIKNIVDSSSSPAIAEFSYNKTSLNTTVTETVYTLSASDTYTDDEDAIYFDAVAAYVGDGNPDPNTQYDIVAVLFPELGFPWGGLAGVGGSKQWLQGNVSTHTIVHEIGHNYGLRHADYWRFDRSNPDSTNPIDDTGIGESYGDIYDVMGEGRVPVGHFHMAAKQLLGWIDESQWEDLSGPEDNGTYRVYQFDNADATGLQALRIARPLDTDHYWVGFRQLYPNVPNYKRGAYIIWEQAGPFSSFNRSWLIDTTPGSPDGKADAGIPIGRTYADVDQNLFITPLATGNDENGSWLDVEVNFGTFAENQAPSGTLDFPEFVNARSPVVFTANVSDPDLDELAFSWNFGDGVIEDSLSALERNFLGGGDFDVSLTVSDRKGGVLELQSTVTVSDPLNVTNVRASGTDETLLALAANGNRVVATGSGGVFVYSDDGSTWNLESLPESNVNVRVNDMIWTGTEFIAVGADFVEQSWIGSAYSSSDGSEWTADFNTQDAVGDFGFLAIAANGDATTILAIGSDAKIYRRESANIWTQFDMELPIGADINNSGTIAFGKGAFIAGGYDFTNQRLVLQKSSDGENWTDISAGSEIGPQGHALSSIEYFNGQFIGSGFTSRVRYSWDSGATWQTNQSGDTYTMSSFAYGNGVYFAHGVNSSDSDSLLDLLSVNGQNWAEARVPPVQAFNDRIFFRDTFVSVGDNGTIVQTNAFASPVDDPYLAWIIGFVPDESIQAATANADQDWASNFIEYALGSDPSDPASIPDPPSMTRDEEGNISISIYRFKKTEMLISPEISSDLLAWSPLAATTVSDTDLLLEFSTEENYYENTPFYIRLKISKPD